jgi:hypothetical protein
MTPILSSEANTPESNLLLVASSKRSTTFHLTSVSAFELRATQWSGHSGRLELVYDRTAESFTAQRPVTFVQDTKQAMESSDEDCVAAMDVGANDFVVTTSNGHQRLFHSRVGTEAHGCFSTAG